MMARPQLRWLLLAPWLLLAACTPEPETFPAEFVTDREAFMRSVVMIEEAGVMLQQAQTDDQPVEPAITQLERGMKIGFRARQSFLDWVHPELNTVYNEELLAGADTYVNGVRSGDVQAQAEGIRRVQRWTAFWDRHREELLERMRVEAAAAG